MACGDGGREVDKSISDCCSTVLGEAAIEWVIDSRGEYWLSWRWKGRIDPTIFFHVTLEGTSGFGFPSGRRRIRSVAALKRVNVTLFILPFLAAVGLVGAVIPVVVDLSFHLKIGKELKPLLLRVGLPCIGRVTWGERVDVLSLFIRGTYV